MDEGLMGNAGILANPDGIFLSILPYNPSRFQPVDNYTLLDNCPLSYRKRDTNGSDN
jgi:hypothetical protein